MFKCKDASGEVLHIEDIVELVEPSPAGLPEGTVVVVMNIYDEETIKVCPEEAGTPEIVSPEAVKVIKSFINELAKLESDADLQKLLTDAEARYEERLKNQKDKKARAKGKSTKPKEQEVLGI